DPPGARGIEVAAALMVEQPRAPPSRDRERRHRHGALHLGTGMPYMRQTPPLPGGGKHWSTPGRSGGFGDRALPGAPRQHDLEQVELAADDRHQFGRLASDAMALSCEEVPMPFPPLREGPIAFALGSSVDSRHVTEWDDVHTGRA